MLALAWVGGGCVRGAEVNRLAIIDVLGLDQAEDGGIEVIAQVVIPTRLGVGPTGSDSQGPSFFLVQEKGATAADAISRLDRRVPRQIFLEHVQAIVIGERLARQGLFPVVDFLVRDREVRTDAVAVVVPGDAVSLLRLAPPLTAVPGEGWRTIVRHERVIVSSVRNLFVSLGEEGMDPFATLVEPSPVMQSGEGGAGTGDIELTGAAVFRGDRLAGFLNREEAFGLQMLINDQPRTVISVREEDVLKELGAAQSSDGARNTSDPAPRPESSGVIALRLVRSDSSLFPAAIDPPTLRLKVRIRTEVADTGSALDVEDAEVARAIERVAARNVRNHVETALRKMQELNADAAGLGAKFRRFRPAWWKEIGPRWADLFPQARLEYDVQVVVARTGLATGPVGLTRQQLVADTEER